MFSAIACGSTEAKDFIPYILQLPDLKNNILTTKFNECLQMVPVWMFIPFISQMLSNYDFEGESYLDELLEKLAVKYPNGELFEAFSSSKKFFINLEVQISILMFIRVHQLFFESKVEKI